MRTSADNISAVDMAAESFPARTDGGTPAAPARALAFAALVALVVLAPLPLGAAREWSSMALVALIGLLVAWEAMGVALSQRVQEPLWRGTLLIPIAYGLALLWGSVQALAPVGADLAHPLWQLAGEALHTGLPGRVSLAPYEGGGTILRLLAYAGVFWLATRHCAARANAGLAVRAVAYAGFAYAIYGLAAQLSGSESILWFEKWAYREALTGTFVNRNSYAAYAGLGLLAALALLLERWGHILALETNLRTRLAFLLDEALGRSAPVLVGVAASIAALLLTGSRGGTFSLIAGVSALLAASAFARVLRLPLLASIAGLLLFLSTLLFVTGGEYFAGRLGEGLAAGAEGRATIARVAGEAISGAPVLGYGLGSFPDLYRLYENRLDRMQQKPTEAHDSYLENAAELGIPAAALLYAALGLLVARCAAGAVKRRRDHMFPILGVGTSALLGVHALADFSLQIPAVAVTYAFLLGAAYAQAFPTRQGHTSGARGLEWDCKD